MLCCNEEAQHKDAHTMLGKFRSMCHAKGGANQVKGQNRHVHIFCWTFLNQPKIRTLFERFFHCHQQQQCSLED